MSSRAPPSLIATSSSGGSIHRALTVSQGESDRRIVLVCNEGYSSSLDAHTLQRIGLSNATDLRGGYQAWLTARTSWKRA